MNLSTTLSVLALAGSASLLVGQAAPKPNVVEAQQFLLRDDQGRLRASLKMGDMGGPQLEFYDAEIPERIRTNMPKGASRDRFVVSRLTVGLAGMQMGSPDGGSGGLSLDMTETGPHLLLYDSKNKGGIEIIVRDGVGPTMTFIDAENTIRGRVEVRTEEPYIKVIGFAGKVLYPAP